MQPGIYRAQHAKLRDLASQLTGRLGGEVARDAGLIRNNLTALSGVLSAHLAGEEDALYPRLIAGKQPLISMLARRFQQQTADLKLAFADHVNRWSRRTIAERPAAFATETRAIMAALLMWSARAERDFYPLVGL